MARLARVVVPGVPHHVTQRGNRRQQTFFSDDDYAAYRDQLAESCGRAGVAVWAWCLMPNHVHLVLVPDTADSLRMALADAHRRYSRHINVREGRRGYPGQGRFARNAPPTPSVLHPRSVPILPIALSTVETSANKSLSYRPHSMQRAHAPRAGVTVKDAKTRGLRHRRWPRSRV